MDRVLWIIQTNLGVESDVRDFVDAIRQSTALVEEVAAIPFTGDLPEYLPTIKYDGPVVLYGSVSFVTGSHQSNRWKPGAFSDPDTFTYDKWVKYYGDLLLNSSDGAQVTTIGEFVNSPLSDKNMVFVRPLRDAKEINGEVQTVGQFRKFCNSVMSGEMYHGISGSTVVVVGEPWGISAEWRLFAKNGEIVAASQYKKNGRLHKNKDVPERVIHFGKMVAQRWDPCPMYVIDVCESAGNLYIMEVQGFNSAGHYDANMDAIVKAANEATLEDFAKLR